jgi:hypothetical protein
MEPFRIHARSVRWVGAATSTPSLGAAPPVAATTGRTPTD